MPYSTQRATSDGSLVALDLAIEYFDRSEITVYFDSVLNGRQWAWVGTTNKRISFTPAVANGVQVLVLRSTDLSRVRHEFAQGAAFTYNTVDEDLLQILHIAQEARENAVLTEVFQDFDLHGYKLLNLGTATQPGDAVSLGQFQAHDDLIVSYKNTAQAAALAAAVSEGNALTYANQAAGVVTAALGVTIQPYDAKTAKINVQQEFEKPQTAKPVTVVSGVAADMSVLQQGTIVVNAGTFTVTNPTGHTDGFFYGFWINYTTTHGLAFGSVFKNLSTYTFSNAAGKKDYLVFRSDGTNLYRVGGVADCGGA
jgi:hypothetical protein